MKKSLCACIAFLFVLTLSSCNYSNKKLLEKRLQNMEKYSGNPGNIEQIKDAIKKYDEDAQNLVEKNAQIGIWYKILGTRYLDKKMYGEALSAFRKAAEFYPENPNLYYYIAVCAGVIAKSSLNFELSEDFKDKSFYLSLSESSYDRAIELDGRYTNALYGLGVLCTYETGDFEKGAKSLEKVVEIEKRNFKAMFALAAAYYGLGEFDNAVSVYDNIIRNTKSAEYKASAESLKKSVLDASYGY